MRNSGKAILAAPLLAALLVLVAEAATAQEAVGGGSDAAVRSAVREMVGAITQEELETLTGEGEVTNLYAAPDGPRLATGFADRIAEDIRRIRPRLGVEVLFLASASGHFVIDPSVFSTLQSISTMEGIEYYSQSRGYMRTLFHESYVIDGPESRNRTPDPVRTTVPETDRLYVFQRDSSFGRNVYQLDYLVDGDAIFLTMTNLTRMLYQGIIPAVGPEQLVFHIIVRPVGDQLLFYGHSGANALTLFGIEDRIQMSFYNRIVALHSWFVSQLDAR